METTLKRRRDPICRDTGSARGDDDGVCGSNGKRRNVHRDDDYYDETNDDYGDDDDYEYDDGDDDDDDPFLGWVPRRVLGPVHKRRRLTRSVRAPCRLIDAVQGERTPKEEVRAVRESPCDRLPDELLDVILNGPHGVHPASRASTRLVCRRWCDMISAPSPTDERRLVADAPDATKDRGAWARGRCVTASVLAAWVRTGICMPSLDVVLARARLACASATAVDVAVAVALSKRHDAVVAAVAMVGGPTHLFGPNDGDDNDNGDGGAAPERASLYTGRPYTVMSTCHALAERVASAAGPRGLGIADVAVALARGGSLPSVLACIDAAAAHDRAETALALVGVAIARRYAHRWSPGHAVDDIVRRAWEASARHGAARTAHLLGSALDRWGACTAVADPDDYHDTAGHVGDDMGSGRDPAHSDDAVDSGHRDTDTPARRLTDEKDGNDDSMSDARRILGDWMWRMVAGWGRAPGADWFCAVAARGHVALLDVARHCGWIYDGPTTAMSALCSGHIRVCALLARWHAEDNNGEFGPLPCEAAVRLLLYAVERGRCTEADLVRGLTWLASATPPSDVPIGAIGQALAPWPTSPHAAAIVDAWPNAVVQSGHLCGGLAAYVYAGRWGDADRLATLATTIAVTRGPHCPCFALWEPWVARLTESVAYDRPDCDGGTMAVEALATLCALAMRAGVLDHAGAPPAARHSLGDDAFLCANQCAYPRSTAIWSDAVRPGPLPLPVALSARALTVDDPRDEIRSRAASLVRWLIDGNLCPDLLDDEAKDDPVAPGFV
ncbi:F-box incomplete domain containing protein [Pandoravirus salinus]|uniref:F-box incomplete domain containing protein n=1 Tax=Pandoravirus salinus TaxID=1349410 RepID=S4VZN8_9VIRU|nr:F-box incomplete domain [Pandoravirus salinus]AGO83502.2 F-box incomplete domain containing protein [Pandoravirus salinus]